MLIDVSKMRQRSRIDLVTVGHLAVDTITTPTAAVPRQALGGSPTYVSLAAAKLGAKVSIISKVGGDFPEEYLEWLRGSGVGVLGLVRGGVSTRFALDYGKRWERRLRLVSRAPSILVSDVPQRKSRAVHVGPIVGEVSADVVLRLRRMGKVLSLDPQGFVRSFDGKGNVSLKRWNAADVLSKVTVFKSTVEELGVVTGKSDLREGVREVAGCGVRVVVVTRGLRGSTLYFDEVFYEIPACKPRVVVDPTGAGDVFVGGFLAEYLACTDPVWCGCVGSAAASFVVEGFGPERFGERDEVYERARQIYGKVTR
jgi:sugar/nucleoside kinase (ribokinase family)